VQRRRGQGNVRQMRTQCGQRTEAADAVRTAGTNFLSAPSLFVTTSVNRAPLFYLSLRHILKTFMALHSVFCFCTETYNWLWFCRKLDLAKVLLLHFSEQSLGYCQASSFEQLGML